MLKRHNAPRADLVRFIRYDGGADLGQAMDVIAKHRSVGKITLVQGHDGPGPVWLVKIFAGPRSPLEGRSKTSGLDALRRAARAWRDDEQGGNHGCE